MKRIRLRTSIRTATCPSQMVEDELGIWVTARGGGAKAKVVQGRWMDDGRCTQSAVTCRLGIDA